MRERKRSEMKADLDYQCEFCNGTGNLKIKGNDGCYISREDLTFVRELLHTALLVGETTRVTLHKNRATEMLSIIDSALGEK